MPQRPGSSLDLEIDDFLRQTAPSRGRLPISSATQASVDAHDRVDRGLSGSVDDDIDGLLASLTRPSYGSMANKLVAPAPVHIASEVEPSGFSGRYGRPAAAEPFEEPAVIAARNAPLPVTPARGPAASPFEQSLTALATGPSVAQVAEVKKPGLPTRLGSAKTGGSAGAPLPPGPSPLDLVSGVLQAPTGAFTAAPTAVGEVLADQTLPGHEGEPSDFLGRLAAHGRMILKGQGGAVAPMSPIGAMTNPPDTVETLSDAQRAARAQLGLAAPETQVRSRGQIVAEETARRGMDMAAKLLTDPTAIAAMGVRGVAGEILAGGFAAQGLQAAADVAQNPNATPEDVAEAIVNVGVLLAPSGVRMVRRGARAGLDTLAQKAGEARAARAAFEASTVKDVRTGKRVPRADLDVLEEVTPPRPQLPAEGEVGTPVRPSEPRPPQGPITSAPVAVRPGASVGSVGPVAPSPEPSPAAAAVGPPPAVLDQEIGQFIEAVAGPEFVPVGNEPPPPAPASAPPPAGDVIARVQDKLAHGERLGTEGARADFAERQRVEEARPDAPPRTLDHEIDRTIGELSDDVAIRSAREEGRISDGFNPKDLTIYERRELRRIEQELDNLPFTKHSFIDPAVGRGGTREVIGGAGGAPVFTDIGGNGSRAEILQAVRDVLAGKTGRGGKVSADGNRAIQVARERIWGKRQLSRPSLPDDAGNEEGVTYVARTPEMSPEETAVERPFRQAVESKTAEMVEAYRTRFGNTVSADDAKELSGPYAESTASRAALNRAVHRASSSLADAVYRTLVKEPAPEGKEPRVTFVAGPTGAGKSTIINTPAFAETLQDAQVIVDGPLSNVGNARQRIQLALDHGKEVNILYVHRDPVEAWAGVKSRGETIGRQPTIDYHLESHMKGLETIRDLAALYADEPRVSIEYVQNVKGQPISLIEASDLPEAYNEWDVRAAIEAGSAHPQVAEPAEGRPAAAAGVDRAGAADGHPTEDRRAPQPPAAEVAPSPTAASGEPPREFSSTQVDLPPGNGHVPVTPKRDYFAEAGERLAERKQTAKRMGDAGEAVRLTHPSGRTALAGPDMSKPGQFRVTRFDKNGEPFGHSEHDSLEKAVYSAMEDDYAPRLATEKSSTPVTPRLEQKAPIPVTPKQAPAEDVLDTGEVQTRLPGAESARKVGKADVTFKAPQQASGEDFALGAEETPEATARREKRERGPALFEEEPKKSPIPVTPKAEPASEAKDQGTEHAFTAENLEAVFGLTEEQAGATMALVKAMGLDTSRLSLARGLGTGSDTLDQALNEAPVFYSALARAVEAKMPNRASAEQILKIVTNPQSGVKSEELKWSGLEAWLKDQTGPVSKAQVAWFLEANQIQIEEVELGRPSRQARRTDDTYTLREVMGPQPRRWVFEDSDGVLRGGSNTRETAEENAEEWAASVRAGGVIDTVDLGTAPAKFEQHTLPGGKNYRELLLTLPAKRAWLNGDPVTDDDLSTQSGREAADRVASYVDDTFHSSHFNEPNIVVHLRVNDRVSQDGKRVLFIEEIQSDWHQKGRKGGYKTGAKGATPAQFSAASRASHRHGHFGYDTASQFLRDAVNEDDWTKTWEPPESAVDRAIIQEFIDAEKAHLQDREAAVPDAPFKTTWHELAVKRALRYAADHGYDAIAWTTGEQQNDRYDLSKHIDTVQWVPWPAKGDGRGILNAYKDHKRVIDEKEIHERQLPDYVGKDVADRLVGAPPDKRSGAHELSGLDLKVGGSGMKGFYDDILPRFANKYAKPFGGKVGDLYLSDSSGLANDGPQHAAAIGAAPVHALDITPEMRQSVLRGQPLFQQKSDLFDTGEEQPRLPGDAGDVRENEVATPEFERNDEFRLTAETSKRKAKQDTLFQGAKGAVEFTEGGKAILRAIENPDVSTAVHEIAHIARRFVFDRNLPPAERAGITDEDIQAAEEWAGAPDGIWSRDAEEKFARGFERYLHDGSAPTSKLRALFDKLKAWLREIYKQLRGSAIDIDISPAMRAVFDKLVSRGQVPVTPRERPSGGVSSMPMGASRPMPPPPRKGPSTPVTERMKPSAIIENLRKGLGAIPVNVGRFRQQAFGIYKETPRAIRLKVANDVQTVAHEFGHHVDTALLNISRKDPNWRDELQTLGQPTSRPSYTVTEQRKEGAAEFLRLYLIDPAAARAGAPNYFAEFDRKLEDRPELKKVLLDARQDIAGLVSQDPATRGKLMIDFTGSDSPSIYRRLKDDPKGEMRNLATLWIDDLLALRSAVEEMADARPIDARQNAYILARNARGTGGMAEGMLEHGVRGRNGRFLSGSLADAITPVKDHLQDFAAYLVAKRVLEVQALKRKETGMTAEEATAIVRQVEEGPQADAMARAAENVYAYNRALLQYAREYHTLSDQQYKTLLQEAAYVPLQRVMDAVGGAFSNGGARKIANRSTPIKRMKGSGRDIINPIESIIRNTFSIIDTVEKNRAMQALVRQVDKSAGSGKWIEKVPAPQVATKFNLSQIAKDVRAELDAAGVDVPDNFDLDAFVKVFTPANVAAPGQNLVTVIRDGERHFYEVHDQALYDAITAMGGRATSTLIEWASKPTALLRAGATLTPGFIARNPTRDTLVAALQSRYGFIPVYDTVRGFLSLALGEDEAKLFLTSGVQQSSLVGADRDRLRKAIERMPAQSRVAFFKNVVRHPIDLLRAISESMEAATRMGEFRLAVNAGGQERRGGLLGMAQRLTTKNAPAHDDETLTRATLAARDVTTDFSRGGTLSKEANRVFAFFNARVQGFVRMAETVQRDPTGTLLTVAALSALSYALWWLHSDDDRYDELPDWEKGAYWHIPTPKGFIKVAKPFEWAYLANVTEAALDHIKKQKPEALARIRPTDAKQLAFSIIPSALLPWLEASFNYDTFRNAPIVKPWDVGLEPELQRSEWTTDTAVQLGKLLGVSPAKVDHIIFGYGAGFARGIVEHGTDPALGLTGLIAQKKAEDPEKKWQRVPLVGTFLREGSYDSSSQSLKDFYQAYDRVTNAERSAKRFAQTDPRKARDFGQSVKADPAVAHRGEIKAAKALFEDLGDEVNRIYAAPPNQLTPQQKRAQLDRLYEQMVDIARRALGRAPLRSTSGPVRPLTAGSTTGRTPVTAR